MEPKKEFKNFNAQIKSSPIRRQTKNGVTVASMVGVEIEGKTKKDVRIALFDETAEKFLSAFEEQADARGEDIASFQPSINFLGYWKKTSWTKKDGTVQEDWEFWGREFNFS